MTEKEEPFVFGPIVLVALVGSCLVLGVSWIPWAIVNILFSFVVGHYVEAKINGLDRAVRSKAQEASGRQQPGSAKELGELVRVVVQFVGVFVPFVTVFALIAAWYMSAKAKSISKIDALSTKSRNGQGALANIVMAKNFSTVGKCMF